MREELLDAAADPAASEEEHDRRSFARPVALEYVQLQFSLADCLIDNLSLKKLRFFASGVRVARLKQTNKTCKQHPNASVTLSHSFSYARALIDRARLDAQINEITYNERIQVKTLVKNICDFKQTYTQYGGVRPFGTALLVAGYDDTGARLFATDPSGALMEYKASSEGAGRNGAMSFFEEKYKHDLSMDEAIDMGIKALHKGTEGKLNPDATEIGVVGKNIDFSIISENKSKEYVKKAIGGN